MKINTVARLKATEVHASSTKEAGKALTKLKPILGKDFKTGESSGEQYIEWEHHGSYHADLILTRGNELSFSLASFSGKGATLRAYGFEAQDLLVDIKSGASQILNTVSVKDEPTRQVLISMSRLKL